MIVEGSYRFPAQREAIWEMLLDPEVIARTMPGAREMERVAHDKYEGKIGVGIGSLMAAEFAVSVVLTDVAPPERYTMLIDGHGKLGFARGSALMRLAADGSSSTVLDFRADLQIGGKVAGVGQRLLDGVARLLMKQALDGLAQEVNRRLKESAGLRPRPSVPEAPAVEPLPRESASLRSPRSPAPAHQPRDPPKPPSV